MDQELKRQLDCLAIIDLDEAPSEAAPDYGYKMAIHMNQARTALTLAEAAAGLPNCASQIFCPGSGMLTKMAAGANLPCLNYDKKLGQIWRIWNWQKQYHTLSIAVLGFAGLKFGARLLKMRKKSPGVLNALFFDLNEKFTARDLLPYQGFICGSNFIGNSLESMLPHKNREQNHPRLFIRAPGLDISSYNKPEQPSIYKDRFVFCMDESLRPQSGALLVIRAMAALWQHPDLPPWEVRMYGSGSRYEEIMAEAVKLGVQSRLCILHEQPPLAQTSHCGVWLAPGQNVLETPAALWAGFAASLPVIASRTPLHMERARDPEAALFINPDNPQDLASAMLKLMTNPDLASRYARRGAGLKSWISLRGMAERILPLLAPLSQPPVPPME